jgi:hypothetical protein
MNFIVLLIAINSSYKNTFQGLQFKNQFNTGHTVVAISYNE